MEAKTCSSCVFESDGLCRLNPPVPMQEDVWEDQGHPMLPERLVRKTVYRFPPATVVCGQYKKRVANQLLD